MSLVVTKTNQSTLSFKNNKKPAMAFPPDSTYHAGQVPSQVLTPTAPKHPHMLREEAPQALESGLGALLLFYKRLGGLLGQATVVLESRHTCRVACGTLEGGAGGVWVTPSAAGPPTTENRNGPSESREPG